MWLLHFTASVNSFKSEAEHRNNPRLVHPPQRFNPGLNLASAPLSRGGGSNNNKFGKPNLGFLGCCCLPPPKENREPNSGTWV